jgi:hypothetical protein
MENYRRTTDGPVDTADTAGKFSHKNGGREIYRRTTDGPVDTADTAGKLSQENGERQIRYVTISDVFRVSVIKDNFPVHLIISHVNQ